MHSAALRERHLPYIESCTLAGLSGSRICVRRILPDVLPVVGAQAVISLGTSLLDLGAISFVGLGITHRAEPSMPAATGEGRPRRALW
ncbi:MULTISPECIES: ABC transporter permease subunit [unclassified Streptomyces]|uniref:ABC transporter permease subunit n=1 Tax=unclassified Streptomyces TaxID=2593676 RepID=UPI0033B09C98